jgi:two-component system, sensor histidine kinase and response regulator
MGESGRFDRHRGPQMSRAAYKILCVDDEPQVLRALCRNLRPRFHPLPAMGAAAGIEQLHEHADIAVVVADMRMPGMDGATFLKHARELQPMAIRLLLTGQTDMNSAIKAINEGEIFRFLTKPCPPDQFLLAVEEAVNRYALADAERHRVEQSMARSIESDVARVKAEETVRTKSAFLATMSHEIRTPMNGIIGLLDVLAYSSLQKGQRETVRLIRDSAETLLGIIDDTLDFAKLEAGKLHIERAPMDLGGAVENICRVLDSTATRAGVSLTVFVDPDIPRSVIGDELRLRQVLMNLVGNGIKFSSGRLIPGRVSLRAELASRNADKVAVDLHVTDNGIGMRPEALSQIFAPFVQADASTSRQYGGTGLGLSISKMLLDLMEGSIAVSSEPEKGTIFTVRMNFGTDEQVRAWDSGRPTMNSLACRLVGCEQPLAADLECYLKHAGALVLRSPDLASVSRAEGQTELVIILPGQSADTWLADEAKPAGLRTLLLRHRSHTLTGEPSGVVTIDVEGLSRQRFYEAVMLAADPPDPGRIEGVVREREPDAGPMRASTAEAPKILVAEDNETNREVIARQLEILGFDAEIVPSGRQALACWRAGAYDLIMTDLRMPDMDGFALTAAIRAEEGAASPIPIIALTANIMPEKRHQARLAGVSDFLVKPVRLPLLRATMERWLTSQQPQAVAACQAVEAAPPANLEVLRSLVGSDPADIRAILQSFRRTSSRSIEDLRRATERGSCDDAGNAAHKLKADARSIGAERLGDLSAEVEDISCAGNLGRLRELLPLVTRELERVHAYLGSLRY